jgi:hypothetical protein
MFPIDALTEFRTRWLPHVSNAGLARVVQLLESGSPFLIHGAFTKAVPMGCLASHIAWNHPATCALTDEEAGVRWLTRVAGLNPATSAVILAWDRSGLHDVDLRYQFLTACRDEQARRAEDPAPVCEADLLTCEC